MLTWRLRCRLWGCGFLWRDSGACNLLAIRSQSASFLHGVWFPKDIIGTVPRNMQSACYVGCEAVGWMQRSYVPEQQSGLIVALSVYLKTKEAILQFCFSVKAAAHELSKRQRGYHAAVTEAKPPPCPLLG